MFKLLMGKVCSTILLLLVLGLASVDWLVWTSWTPLLLQACLYHPLTPWLHPTPMEKIYFPSPSKYK